jgi:hypothetical protein
MRRSCSYSSLVIEITVVMVKSSISLMSMVLLSHRSLLRSEFLIVLSRDGEYVSIRG